MLAARTGNLPCAQKATAARPSPAKTAGTELGTDIGALTVQSLGQQLREVLPTRRLHSVSLCDHSGERAVAERRGASDPMSTPWWSRRSSCCPPRPHFRVTRWVSRTAAYALFLPVRAPTGDLVGIAMILADGKSVGDDTLERMTATPVRAIMQRLAVLLKPAALRSAAAASVPLELGEPAAARAAPTDMSPAEVNDVLEFELLPNEMPAPPARRAERASAAAAATRPASGRGTAATTSDMMNLEFVDLPVIDESAASDLAPAGVMPVADPVIPATKAAAPVATPVATAAAAPEHQPATTRRDDPRACGAGGIAASGQRSEPAARSAALRETARRRPDAPLPGDRAHVARYSATRRRSMHWSCSACWRGSPHTARPGTRSPPASPSTSRSRRSKTSASCRRSPPRSTPTASAPRRLGFEIAEALCTQRRAQVERFITQCEKLGAWVRDR